MAEHWFAVDADDAKKMLRRGGPHLLRLCLDRGQVGPMEGADLRFSLMESGMSKPAPLNLQFVATLGKRESFHRDTGTLDATVVVNQGEVLCPMPPEVNGEELEAARLLR